jgi:hypothetical protein
MAKRIGASSKASIDPTILQQLNQGVLATATLSECLAIDFAELMHHLFPNISPSAITALTQAQSIAILFDLRTNFNAKLLTIMRLRLSTYSIFKSDGYS